MDMKRYEELLERLRNEGNLRSLPKIEHRGHWVGRDGNRMLNLSSNDYLGLASRADWQEAFIDEWQSRKYPFSSSSSRLLTGNFEVCDELEALLAVRYGREAALLFNSGYHANTGILPALADKQHDLILADKLVHASLIDGIRLCGANFRRYRHNDMQQLEALLSQYAADYEQVFVVTESIFSMDGDVADLRRLVALKRQFPNVVLYVDEAHRNLRQGVGFDGGVCGLQFHYPGVSGESDASADIQHDAPARAGGLDALYLRTATGTWRRARTLEAD